MIDYGAKYTDDQIRILEKRVKQVYAQAQQELQETLDEHWRKFRYKDEKKREQVKNGVLTQEQYQNWLMGQVFQGDQWAAKRDAMAQTLTNATKTCNSFINDAMPSVFAENANYIGYQVEHGLGIDMGFRTYNEQAVRRLLVEEPNLLPLKKVEGKDFTTKVQRWNTKVINKHIIQGIIQGRGYKDIAERLQDATGMAESYANTNVRTAMTGSQNAGRLQTMRNLEKQGLKLKKKWSSIPDSRTRPEHIKLNGQLADVDKPFVVSVRKRYEIMYPADPNAAPEMAYNCRCRISYEVDPASRKQVVKLRMEAKNKGWNPKEMSFPNWLQEKGKIVVRETEESQDREIGRDNRSVEEIKRGETLFIATRVTGTINEIYVSDKSEYLKPNQIRFIDNMITDAQKKIGILGHRNVPMIIIADATELNSNAVATYNYGMNRMFINNVARSRETLVPAQSQFTCSDNILSSVVHEFLHWKDTQEYIDTHGNVDGYIGWIKEKSKAYVEKLINRGYNIQGISEYASRSIVEENYDEVYTEYRTMIKLR